MIREILPLIDSREELLPEVSGTLFLLLDGVRFDDVYAFIHRMKDQPVYVPLFMGTYYESILEGSPCLIQLESMADPFLDWFMAETDSLIKGLLIVSELDLIQLADHFRQFFEATLPDGGKAFFRFYDPQVFHFMSELHTKSNMAALLEPCRAVCWEYDGTFARLCVEDAGIEQVAG